MTTPISKAELTSIDEHDAIVDQITATPTPPKPMTRERLVAIRVVWDCRGGSYPMPEDVVGEAIEELFVEVKRCWDIAEEHAALLDAVRYALRRVQEDPDYRHHMLGTETMERMCRAMAMVTGHDYETVLRECSVDRQPDYRRRDPSLIVERRRVATLERIIERLAREGDVSWERLDSLRAEAEKAGG